MNPHGQRKTPSTKWRKSTRSDSGPGQCVEVGTYPNREIAMRDSKSLQSGVLKLRQSDWHAFVRAIQRH